MGKIFGISDNPVSIIGKVTQPAGERLLPKLDTTEVMPIIMSNSSDKFVSQKKLTKSNKTQNLFRKLLLLFSNSKKSI